MQGLPCLVESWSSIGLEVREKITNPWPQEVLSWRTTYNMLALCRTQDDSMDKGESQWTLSLGETLTKEGSLGNTAQEFRISSPSWPSSFKLHSFICPIPSLCLLILTENPGFATDSTTTLCSELLAPNYRRTFRFTLIFLLLVSDLDVYMKEVTAHWGSSTSCLKQILFFAFHGSLK